MNDHDNDNWPRANNDNTIVLLVATLAILVITGTYVWVQYLIGVPPL